MKLRKKGYLILTLGVVLGLVGAVRIGEITAKRIMRGPTPLDLADAQARDDSQRWWADSYGVGGPVSLPAADLPDRAAAPPAPVERTLVVGKGDTLMDLLLRGGVIVADAKNVIDAIRDVFDPRAIKPGFALTLTFGTDDAVGDGANQGQLVKVSLPLDANRTIEARRDQDDGFSATRIDLPLSHAVVRAQGVIHTSLYEDGIAAGLSAPLVAEMIRAFSYDVDFQREIQSGDRFEVAYERFVDARGRVVKTGNLNYASLTLSGHTFKVYRYQPKHGVADYFNEKGQSVRKALLRTPIDGARITSGYGMRLHPILGYTTMHKGVDFGAPTGTPIMAAGAGVVELAGFRGNYGVYLRVKHNRQYSTAYAHMSRIAAGIHIGSRVHQGQVIGYVGATGLATGPHLYYEVLVNNRQINPLSVRLPTGVKLAGAELKSFEQAKALTDRTVATLPSANKVAKSAF